MLATVTLLSLWPERTAVSLSLGRLVDHSGEQG